MTLEQYLLEFLFTCEVSTNDSLPPEGKTKQTNKIVTVVSQTKVYRGKNYFSLEAFLFYLLVKNILEYRD